MPRGRPIRSAVRENIIEILYFLGKAYGYEIYKVYKVLFPKVTLRLIYYHLKKGIDLEEFKVEKVEKEKGDYSWGGTAEKTYYALGPKAKPKMDKRVKEYIDKIKSSKGKNNSEKEKQGDNK